MKKYLRLMIVVAFCVAGAGPAWAHGGGLDSYGCHHNRKAGGYHCHRGSLGGQHFDSKAGMLGQLKASDDSKQKKAPAKERALKY